MKLSLWTQVTERYERGTIAGIIRNIEQMVNLIAEGRMAASYAAATAAPTTGNWTVGDFVRKSVPSEQGSAGSKYIITGWICVTSGSPGTWKEHRVLTGN